MQTYRANGATAQSPGHERTVRARPGKHGIREPPGASGAIRLTIINGGSVQAPS